MVAHIERHVSTTQAIEVGVIGVNLPAGAPAAQTRYLPRRGAHVVVFDTARLTESLAIRWARRVFGDSIRIVTTAQLAGA